MAALGHLVTPSVSRMVHYRSRGSADGAYPPLCRAAVVAAVEDGESEQVALVVLNPEGLFFNQEVEHDEEQAAGTWHWPERVE